MQTEKLDQYKLLYSEYINHAVKLHNHHLLFCKDPSYEGGMYIRRAIRNMVVLEKEMVRVNRAAYEEHKKNLKEAKKIARGTNRKKIKHEYYNTTTTTTI